MGELAWTMSSQWSQRKYVALLAVISGGILVIGSLLKPREAPDVPISQAELTRLQTLTQRRNLEDLTSYFSGIAENVKPGLVWLEDVKTSGIIWEGSGLIITAYPGKLPGETVNALTQAGGITLQTDVFSSDFPVASLKAPAQSGLQPVFRQSAASLLPGTWILMVTGQEGGGQLITPGTYGGIVTAKCGDFDVEAVKTSLPLTDTTAGGGVFDMDGNLLGVILRCGGSYNAVTPESVDAVLAEAGSLEGQLSRRYGMWLEALDEDMRRYFRIDTGVLVTGVCQGMPADIAGLAPGDVIQALDDIPVNKIDDMALLALPMAYPTFNVYLTRGFKSVRLNLKASDSDLLGAVMGTTEQGIQLTPPAEGYLIERVISGSRAERAFLKPGDRIIEIGGKQYRNLAQVRKVLSDTSLETVFVVVARGRRKLGVFLR